MEGPRSVFLSVSLCVKIRIEIEIEIYLRLISPRDYRMVNQMLLEYTEYKAMMLHCELFLASNIK